MLYSLVASCGRKNKKEKDNLHFVSSSIEFRIDVFPHFHCLFSLRYIRPNYVYWSMVRSAYNEDEEGGTSDEDVANRNRMSDASGRSDDEGNSDGDEFDYPLDKMSITPRDSSMKFGGRMQRFTKMPSRIRPSTSPESL